MLEPVTAPSTSLVEVSSPQMAKAVCEIPKTATEPTSTPPELAAMYADSSTTVKSSKKAMVNISVMLLPVFPSKIPG